MTSRGTFVFVLLGTVLLAVLWFLLSFRAENVVVDGGQLDLPFSVENVDTIVLRSENGVTNRLVRTPSRTWQLVEPFTAEVATTAVMRILDTFASVRPSDHLSLTDLRDLRRRPRDFGLDMPRKVICLQSGSRTFVCALGALTPSRKEVYAHLGANPTIFTLPIAFEEALPYSPAALRERSIFHVRPAHVTAADFRVPGTAFTRLVRTEGQWRLERPIHTAAENVAVEEMLTRLSNLQVLDFVWPVQSTNVVTGGRAEDKLSQAHLASYGFDGEDEFSVTLWNLKGLSERITFGKPAGTNRVYALMNDGKTVVTVSADVVEGCRAARMKFLDTRIFPITPTDASSLTLMVEGMTYVLAQSTNGVWSIESPVMAPADAAVVAQVLDHVLHLKQNDRVPTGKNTVTLRVTSSSQHNVDKFPEVTVVNRFLRDPLTLRSKKVCSIPSDIVRCLTVTAGDYAGSAGETAVVREAANRPWKIAGKGGSKAGVTLQPSITGIAHVLAALADVTAARVESINPSREDFVRCGLAPAAIVISADVISTAAIRHTLMLGQAAPGGGRYATVGGVDAIFVLSREAVVALTTPLVESKIEASKVKAVK